MARRELPLIEELKSAWQRKDIVLSVLHSDCEACARTRRALLTAGGPLRGFDLAVVMLEGEKHRQALARTAGVEQKRAFVLVADRYLELFTTLDAHPQDLDAFIAELSDWVEAVQRQVCECSRMPDEPT